MFKRILSVALICLLVLSCAGCGKTDSSVLIKSDSVTGYKASGEKGALALSDNADLVKVAENDYLALYYHKDTLAVTVFDKRTGKSYSTAPAEESADKSNARQAMLNLVYSNSQGKNGSIDSYTKSVMLDQAEVEIAGKSVTFNYSIGDVSDGLEVTPSIMTNERFEALLEKADTAQQKMLKRRYSYFKSNDTWGRRNITSPVAINDLIELFNELGYTEEDLKRDNEENGVSLTVKEKLSFFVPVTFTLEEDSVVASIDLEKVTSPSNNVLIKIEFLQFLGAVTGNSGGYFLLPDGSGAVMPFDKVENGAVHYEAPVYGFDNALRKTVTAAKQSNVYMPVYGVSCTDGGFFAVIEDGEALADIYACNSGATDNYNKVYSIVNFLKTESVSLGDANASDNFNYFNFQNEHYKGNYSVRYIFLEKGNNDYNAMAKVYRDYLENTSVLSSGKTSDNAPFVLETVGGILAEKKFLGFQYEGITALTEYEDNIEMTEKLTELGVKNIALRLTGYSGDGLQLPVPTKVKLISALGGNSGFKALLSAAEEKNISLYPDVHFLSFSANNGVSAKNKYAMNSMDYKASSEKIINYATLLQNTQISDNLNYLMAISRLDDAAEGTEKFLEKFGLKSLSIADMATSVSSDFSDENSYDRQSAVNKVQGIIKNFSDKYSLMLNAANVKNAAAATIITEAPLWSSQYAFAEGIPFYSMVYHGSVDYTGNSINLSSDSETEFLRCVEYGASLKYTLIYRNGHDIKNSDYTELYAAEFAGNAESASENYKSLNALYKKTSKAYIKSHKKLAENIFCTEYSNGTRTIVNYSNKDYSSQYGKVPARDFIVIG